MPSATEDLFGSGNTVPMPKGVFDEKDWEKYEAIVDDYISKNKLKPNDTFKVDHPEGPTFYKYNGKDSGGRKDWQEIEQKGPQLMSQATRDLGFG